MTWKCPICDAENTIPEKYCHVCGWGKNSAKPPKPAGLTSYPEAALVRIDSLDRIDVTGGKILGRSTNCDIIIPDPFISRRHAKIVFEDMSYFIEDLGSRNGTFVNDGMLPARSRTPLRDGDILRFGSTTFRFELVQSDTSDKM